MQPQDKQLPLPSYEDATPSGRRATHDLGALLQSPTAVPSSPAPAYTALPDRNVDFHLAPMLGGRVGDIELETTDKKRFLVHRKLLEQETVFFHIYYGFVPVWRLQSNGVGPPHPHFPSNTSSGATSSFGQATSGALNNLLCLPKLLASHLRGCPPNIVVNIQNGPRPNATQYTQLRDDNHSTAEAPDSPMDVDSDNSPPVVPPKDTIVTAPTPTSSPYTWAVPESSAVLAAFLYLIYPRGTFSVSVADALPTLELTGRVIRAAMGYQSSKGLATARDRLLSFIETQPLEVYAMSCFFKFTDLAKLSSTSAMAFPPSTWNKEVRALMGKNGMKNLEQLQQRRIIGLKSILHGEMELDGHSEGCVRRKMMEQLWKDRVTRLAEQLQPESELMELLEMDLRGGHCGDCLTLMGKTVKRCLVQARDLPRTV